ncbi:MAG: tRNA adenosine(34) deaminase TadA [bacterium]|jgi:tRNA(adenine34) deaminase
MLDDEALMREALAQAQQAYALGEVPIGAVVAIDGDIIGRGHNLRETAADPTAHAEIVALRRAAGVLGGWRLNGATLYVTIEPCPMCAGALIQARVRRLVFGAKDPKAGAVGSVLNLLEEKIFNHTVEVTAGVLAEECRAIMQDFFRQRR